MNPIFHLVYISEAAEDISYTDIHDILEVSRRNNSQEAITGLLIFRDGHFLQLLEGDEKSVRKVLGKILLDDRNYSLRVLIEAEGDQRLFPNWTMAFYDGDVSPNSTEDLINLFDACLDGGASRRSLIMPMLHQFRASAPELK
ncbi:BLUF domain-containing protein [uncultured Bdellovibrio sp.]|uniref:BLUF domain-containing protein n=1 Tax=Bdellovibrio sp. HCB-162 TaxID=3394234 RepID=UPI0025DEB7F8|nr:BLUF domain-containing protein [uncultured Bdellovibrio sp.]